MGMLRLRYAQLVNIVGIITVFIVTFFLLLPVILQDWPYSAYYNGTGKNLDVVRKVVWANDQRVSDAKQYLQYLPETKHPTTIGVNNFVGEKQYDLVIVVISMSRVTTLANEDHERVFNLGYLTQTVARLLQIFHTDNTAAFRHKKLIVCNVDPQPLRYTEALELSKYVHIISQYQNKSAKWNGARNMFEREKDDYVYCLKTASRFTSQYYLVIEDDVLLDEHALETVYFIMSYFRLFFTVDWLFLKLYYPEKWSGYGHSWITAVEVGGYAVLGGSLCAAMMMLIPRHRKCLSNCQNLPAWFWFVVGGVFTALLCMSVGRQYVESWRQCFTSTHRLIEAPGCCTQAVLYPAHVISDLSVHLQHVHSDFDFSVDLAIDGFAHVHNLKCYLVQPNLAKHIGFISSLRQNSKSAQHFL